MTADGQPPDDGARRERRSALRGLGLALGLVGLAWALLAVAVWLVESEPESATTTSSP
jgi:hypothetical protein